jgi:hypothetical protein
MKYFTLIIQGRKHIIESTEQDPLNTQMEAYLIKKVPAIYEARKFITVFTRALHWSIS